MSIALFGGSFNPVHMAHLIIAERVVDALPVEQLLFMPCALPPLKSGAQMAPAEERLEMLRLAIAGNSRFALSDLEIRRGGKSFTVDTLMTLQQERKLSRTELFLVIGGDNLADLRSWREPEAINRLCRIVVADRPGAPWAERVPEYVTDLEVVDTPLMHLSSTDIRLRISSGRSIRYLVPAEVERYIHHRRLYLG